MGQLFLRCARMGKIPMTSIPSRICVVLVSAASVVAFELTSPATSWSAPNIYAAAVQHPGRPEADLKRDENEHPAEVLRLSGIKPGMQVADVLAADGYYSELLSYVVGPKGHVLLLNNDAYENYAQGGWAKRLEGNRLPNVEHRVADLEHLDL